MATTPTLAKLSPNPDFVAGNKRFKFRTVTFGTYQDTGETIDAADLGLKRIDFVAAPPIVAASATTTGIPFSVAYNSERTQVTLTAFESGASGAALAEKTDNEAWPTGAAAVVLFVGH
jgi:hypothetical protein